MNDFDRNNHKNWRWGIFYVNPDDPSLWVEKRTGLGWTLNFAHRSSYVFIGLFLVMLVALSVVF